ncbi:MAG: hypothetical protein V4660_08910 [Pseudomonadota bacterium]
MQINERLKVTKDIVWQVNTYQDILEYLSYDLHDSPSPITQNEGLYFIWRSIMGLQILTLSKLIKDDGAFSFKKLINIGGASIKGFDKPAMLEEFEYIHEEYVKHRLDSVRDQFIAHLDISADEIKTDIHVLCVKKNMVTSLYNRISIAIGEEEYCHDDRCVKNIRGIFEELDEHERFKAILIAAQIKGREHVEVKEFIEEKC